MDAKQVEGDARETLEVESSEDRQARLGQLFSSITGEASRQDPGIPVIGERKTFQVGESDALARAKAFLPLMASSNAELLSRAQIDPSAVDIENVQADEKVIAMDLGLGVFEVKDGVKGNFGPEVEVDGSRGDQVDKQRREGDRDGDDDDGWASSEDQNESESDSESGSEEDEDSTTPTQ